MSALHRRLGPDVTGAIFTAVGLAVCSLALSGLLGSPKISDVAPQDQLAPGEKMVGGGGGNMFDAIGITKVSVGDITIQSRTPFQAGDDWVQNMSIFLKNRTNKTIVYVYILLGFPEAGDGRTEPYGSYMLELGLPPKRDATLSSDKTPDASAQDSLSFAPDQILEVHVGDYIDGITSAIQKKMPVTAITKCVIHLQEASFEDGMRWTGGRGFGYPDTEHPGRLKYFDRHYFPGDFKKNWPPWQ